MIRDNIQEIPFVDLTTQYQNIQAEIDAAIAEVIAQTAFISGKYARKFEEEFATWLGVDHCIGCANGTDAIEIMLKALGIGPEDEVIVPACTWISTAEAVSSLGAHPVFIDMHSRYYTLDLDQVEAGITPRTKAIIPVHLYGLAVDMERMMEVANQHGLAVIEDCAQAHGATWNGRKVGTFGHGATFSFYPGKNLGAYGDAGCMVTNDPDLAKTVRAIANHGQPVKHTHTMIGRNSRMDGIQAAILSAKLPHLDLWTALRQQHAQTYHQYLKDIPVITPELPAQATHVYHLYVIQTDHRDALKQALKKRGIQTSIHYPNPLPFTEVYAANHADLQSFHNAYTAKERILSIPMYPELSQAQIDYVCTQINIILSDIE